MDYGNEASALFAYLQLYFLSTWNLLCMLISQCAKIELLPSNETSWDIEDKYTIEDKYRMTKFATIL